MRSLLFITLLTTLSCSTDTLIHRIEKLGIHEFKTISYGLRGDVEWYTYYFEDGTTYVWTYDRKTDSFNFDTHPQKDHAITELCDINAYADKVRTNIESLNVSMISQSPWPGNLIRFWVSNTKFICYVNPDFKFDSDAKRRWLSELKTGEKVRDNWYSVTIDD